MTQSFDKKSEFKPHLHVQSGIIWFLRLAYRLFASYKTGHFVKHL